MTQGARRGGCGRQGLGGPRVAPGGPHAAATPELNLSEPSLTRGGLPRASEEPKTRLDLGGRWGWGVPRPAARGQEAPPGRRPACSAAAAASFHQAEFNYLDLKGTLLQNYEDSCVIKTHGSLRSESSSVRNVSFNY